VVNYKKTLEDTVQDEIYAREQLVLCYFQMKDYEAVIEHSEIIKPKSTFRGSKQQFCYGMALKELGKVEDAEAELKQIDRPYSNYAERLGLANFYIENNKSEEGKALLEEISLESKIMTKPNQKLYRSTITEVERLLNVV